MWNLIIPAAASIIGGAMSSKGARDAGKTAAAASEREIEFNRESRDLAREDQRPYREAGYTALNALMDMTGLSAPRATSTASNAPMVADSVGTPRLRRNYGIDFDRNVAGGAFRGSSYYDFSNPYKAWQLEQEIKPAYAGASMSGGMYNVSEVAPENVYRRGKVMRYANPVTIDGETGYVEPNIEGRVAGGVINPEVDYYHTAVTPRDSGGAPVENTGAAEGGYSFKTDPGYNFRFNEGQRALEKSAAARGGLLSGGFARKAIRYGQDYASNEYSNVYNRIANIAGLGQVANNQSANAALYAGANMGQAAANSGYALAAGQQAAGNAWANAGNQIAQLPWGEIFNRDKP